MYPGYRCKRNYIELKKELFSRLYYYFFWLYNIIGCSRETYMVLTVSVNIQDMFQANISIIVDGIWIKFHVNVPKLDVRGISCKLNNCLMSYRKMQATSANRYCNYRNFSNWYVQNQNIQRTMWIARCKKLKRASFQPTSAIPLYEAFRVMAASSL